MSIFNGAAADIENNKNKVDEITEASTNEQYPGAKATYDLVKQKVNGTIKPIELTGTELDVTASPQLGNGFYKAAQNMKLVRAQGETENFYIPKDAVFSVFVYYDSEIGGDYTNFEIRLLNDCLLPEYNGTPAFRNGYNYFYARTVLGTELSNTVVSRIADEKELKAIKSALDSKLGVTVLDCTDTNIITREQLGALKPGVYDIKYTEDRYEDAPTFGCGVNAQIYTSFDTQTETYGVTQIGFTGDNGIARIKVEHIWDSDYVSQTTRITAEGILGENPGDTIGTFVDLASHTSLLDTVNGYAYTGDLNRLDQKMNQKLNAAANASAQQFCGALKGSSCGTALRLDDVSPVEHSIRLKASSKNLLDTAKCIASQYFKITEKANGAITVTDTNAVNRQPVLEFLRNALLPAGSYTFSCNFSLENVPTKANEADTTRLNELMVFVDGTYKTKTDAITADGSYYKELSFTLSKPSVVRIAWYRNINDITPADSTYKAAFSNIQLEKNAAATAYTPYISDFSTTKIRAAGKNLINCRLWKNSATTCGVTVQYLEDEDCFVLNGTATHADALARTNIEPIPYVGKAISISTFYLSGDVSYPPELKSNAVFYLGKCSENKVVTNVMDSKNFATADSSVSRTITSADFINCAWFWITTGVHFENYKVRIQLELGSDATEYEPYSAADCTVNSNGEVAGVFSRYPVTSFIAENPGVVLTAEYNRDVNRAFADLQQAIISLGGNA